MDENYVRFKNAVRPDVKLKIALSGYIELNRVSQIGAKKICSCTEAAEEYRSYLSARRRAAWELLIREENLDGLRLFAGEDWLTCEDARGCLDLAVKTGKRESQLWLLQYMKNPGEMRNVQGNRTENQEERSETVVSEISREILTVLRRNLQSRIPALASAFPGLVFVEMERETESGAERGAVSKTESSAESETGSKTESGAERETKSGAESKAERRNLDDVVWGTDGRNLYYASDELISSFQRGMDGLARAFLHSLFHCLYLHMIPPQISESKLSDLESYNLESCDLGSCDLESCDLGSSGLNPSDFEFSGECWNLACDLAVEWAIDASTWYPLASKRQKLRSVWYQQILKEQKRRDTESCYRWLTERRKAGQYELLQEIQKEFSVDCHDYWYENKKRCENEKRPEEKTLEDREGLALTWAGARQSISLMLCGSGQRAGKQGGGSAEAYRPGNRKTYDYRKFLKQFAVCREEMQLDMESFDYIPYYYGLERYGNVLLVEPLETTEVNRLEEFVIAIDTSGSCSGETVCRFLDETYRILSSRENFFRKMNVHIIQCDSVIQDHRKITCEEDWKEYQKKVKIQGLGGTDFTPVFRLVDAMIERKEIRNLKGLLYFTDGDGIFPRQKPSYETAFVFLNRALEKSRIPDWAIRLNLEIQ